jgi:hypothetical protein
VDGAKPRRRTVDGEGRPPHSPALTVVLPVALPDVVAGPGLDVELVRRPDPGDVLLEAVGLAQRVDGVERLPELRVREQRVDLSSSASADCG